ncbi:MAG: CheR family methyltransferase [Cellvibrionaceae bacterium]
MAVSETLSDRDFSFVQDLIYTKTGIVIADHKREMIYRRLARRARDLNLAELTDYCEILRSESEEEMVNFVNAVTTNLTSFFRENHHFEFLKETFFPEFLSRGEQRLRIWSSAASTGEEPYSISMTMLEGLGEKYKSIDAKILATDLDTQVLQTARSGIYHKDRLKDLSSAIKSKWFSSLDTDANKYSVDSKLKVPLTFNKLNLLGDWPMKGKFDVIFCRNVLIYFDRPTQEKLVNRFLDVLTPNGILMLGHSESILKGSTDFEHLGKTIYKRL